jgi:hypothetical protein
MVSTTSRGLLKTLNENWRVRVKKREAWYWKARIRGRILYALGIISILSQDLSVPIGLENSISMFIGILSIVIGSIRMEG